MQKATCFNETCTRENCLDCPERALLHTTLDIENEHAEKSLEELPYWIAGVFLVIVAVGLIIATNIFM